MIIWYQNGATNVDLLYMDTNSLIPSIKTDDSL